MLAFRHGSSMDAITLAHQPVIRLHDLEIRPATRTLARAGREEVVEPRVMKVLVALLQADGAVVARDDLIASCWDGRIVGDDAVNRIMSRLRRLSEGIGAGLFQVETINKVGYRLRTDAPPSPAADEPLQPRTAEPALATAGRRTFLLGAGGAIAAAAAGGWLLSRRPGPPSAIAGLMSDALAQVRQNTREGQNQGIGLYRQVVEQMPDYSPGWASLSLTYALVSRYREHLESASLLSRAREAAARAQALAPNDPLTEVAAVSAQPLLGHWSAMEPVFRRAARREPANEWVLSSLSGLLQAVGYAAEALAIDDRIAAIAPPTPGLYYSRIRSAWLARQWERTDQLLDEAARIYPTHYGIWFSRFYISMSNGRPDAAIALAADRSSLPTNIDLEEIGSVVRVAEAARSRAPAAIDAVQSEWLARARRGSGLAENSAQFLGLLGRSAGAMQVLNAYFFGDGFAVPELRFTVEQGTYTPVTDRLTPWIGSPMLAGLHHTPEFARLCERLGLSAFWRAQGRVADWLRR